MSGEETRSGRSAAVHARTRDEILDAAAELVTERGVEAFTLSELAALAGFGNAASLYRYFSSKQEIVNALASRGLERLGEHMRRVPQDLAPEEQIVQLCLAYVNYALVHPGERRLLLTTAAGLAPGFRAATPPDEFVRRAIRLLREAGESGVFAGRDEGDLFALLNGAWALAHGMAEYDGMYLSPEREVLRSRHEMVFRAYVRGFRGGD